MEPKGQGKPSKVEVTKLASDYLRGSIANELTDGKPNITDNAASILKFHGSYQQDDRDLRAQNRREGKEKAFQFMVRTRVPGGKITAAQYLAEDELARTVGNGTLRITTRQEFQLHGILKEDLKHTIAKINRCLLSTLAACGDVERNVLCCPAPIHDKPHQQMQHDCDALASHFAPRTTAYYDLWLDGEKIENPDFPRPQPALVPTAGDDPVEPLYGKAYMNRKFKTAFAFPDDNCTDVHVNELGFIAIVEDGEIAGYNVVVGGSFGTTPSAAKTFPAVAKTLCYIDRPRYLRLAEAVLKVHRDYGDRSDRKRARLKYLIHDWGIPAFRAKVEEYLGEPVFDPKPIEITDVDDHLGWHEQGDGKLFLGIPIENGRVHDANGLKLMTGLRTFFETYGTPARLTCQQSILLKDLDPAWKADIERLLVEHGIATVEHISTVRRWSMACPALPTCGLAVTEAERVFPAFLDRLEPEIERLGLQDERFTIRMTGCPNGCARPYNSDIGLVGRSAVKTADGGNEAGTYTIFLGGRVTGERINVLYKDYVHFDDLVPELAAILERFRDERLPGETLGDFCHRQEFQQAKEVPEPSTV